MSGRASALSSAQVCQLVGCSYRQLDYWTRAGLVSPTVPADGQGSRRAFSRRDVEQVRRIAVTAERRRRTIAEQLQD
jgi:DNA-binding transcriptional MerR regulator